MKTRRLESRANTREAAARHSEPTHLEPASWQVSCPYCRCGIPVHDVGRDDAGTWFAARGHETAVCTTCDIDLDVRGCMVEPSLARPRRLNRGD